MFGKTTGHQVTPLVERSRVGEFLARGIERASDSVADAMWARARERKGEEHLAEGATALAKALRSRQQNPEAPFDINAILGANPSGRAIYGAIEGDQIGRDVRSYLGRQAMASQAETRAQQSHEARMRQADQEAESAPLRQEILQQQIGAGDLRSQLMGQEIEHNQLRADLLKQQLKNEQQRLSGMGLGIPEGLEISGATVDAKGNISYSYRASGKDLSQTELEKLAAIQKAKADLDRIKAFYDSKAPGMGGPISDRLRRFGRWWFGIQDPNQIQAENLAQGAVGNLSRGVMGEVGVLTDADREHYMQLIPAFSDKPATRKVKFDSLYEQLSEQLKISQEALLGAGRNVPQEAPPTPTTYQRGTSGRLAPQ